MPLPCVGDPSQRMLAIIVPSLFSTSCASSIPHRLLQSPRPRACTHRGASDPERFQPSSRTCQTHQGFGRGLVRGAAVVGEPDDIFLVVAMVSDEEQPTFVGSFRELKARVASCCVAVLAELPIERNRRAPRHPLAATKANT
jgi:hypothetical protein